MAPAPTLYARQSLPRTEPAQNLPPLVGGNLALDFINTSQGNGAPDALMPGYSNLLAWSVHAGIVEAGEAHRLQPVAGRNPRDAAAIRQRAVALREALRSVALACIEGIAPPPHPLQLLAGEVHLALAARTLTGGDGGLRWVWTHPQALGRMLADVSLAAEALLTGEQVRRVRQCAAPDCDRLFLDTSRNGLRRYCSASGCGTRERVRHFRERQRSKPEDSSQEET